MANAVPPKRRHLADRIADYANVGDSPGQLRPWTRVFNEAISPLLRLCFRPRLTGWEHLPEGRPFLVVSNHSGGGIAEIACLVYLWQQRFGNTRPIAGMAAPPVFLLPVLSQMVRGVGAVPATYRHAEEAFAKGASVIVFPGGDHDAFRPIWQANRVDFNGRKGYLRLARKLGVPIVPLGIQGSHYTAPILWRSKLTPWLLLLPLLFAAKRLPITLLGALIGAAVLGFAGPLWGYASAGALAALCLIWPLFAFVPIIPWPIRFRVGSPLEPEGLFGEGDEDQALEAASEKVVGEIQRLVLERD